MRCRELVGKKKGNPRMFYLFPFKQKKGPAGKIQEKMDWGGSHKILSKKGVAKMAGVRLKMIF